MKKLLKERMAPALVGGSLAFLIYWLVQPSDQPAPPSVPLTPQEIYSLPPEAKILWSWRDMNQKWVKFSLNGECFIMTSRGCGFLPTCYLTEAALTSSPCPMEPK